MTMVMVGSRLPGHWKDDGTSQVRAGTSTDALHDLGPSADGPRAFPVEVLAVPGDRSRVGSRYREGGGEQRPVGIGIDVRRIGALKGPAGGDRHLRAA